MPRMDVVNASATSVYAVSVDSRSRPLNQPDNKYDIELGRTLDRVKSVQLGSIQIPDCRYAFDTRSCLHYSEPLTIPGNTVLFIKQTTKLVDKASCVETTSSRVVQVTVPPTLNKVVAYDAGTDTVTLEYPAGLPFALAYYPLVQLKPRLIGGHFPQSLMTVPMPPPFPTESGPVFTDATVTPVTDSTYTYSPGYLAALTSGAAGTYQSRHILPGAWSYVSAPKPTLVELFTMLNAALAARVNAPDPTGHIVNVTTVNATTYELTTALPHNLHVFDELLISFVNGTPTANGVSFVTAVPTVTTFRIRVGATGGVYTGGGTFVGSYGLSGFVQFGFNDVNDAIQVASPVLTSETRTLKSVTSYTILSSPVSNVSSLSDLLGFGNRTLDPPAVAKVPPYIIRTIKLRPGNYSADELTTSVSVRMNPLAFFSASSAPRTLRYQLPVGTSVLLTIPRGRFTVDQFVIFMNAQLNPAPAQVTLVYDASSAKFTFAHSLGLQFGLLFGDTPLLAMQLGFEPVNYTGSASYTSPVSAVFGVPSTAPPGIPTFPANTYYLSADISQRRFTFDSGDQMQLFSTAPLYNAGVVPYTASWTLEDECGGSGVAVPWCNGEVVSARAPFYVGAVTNVTSSTPAEVTVSAPHGLSSGDCITMHCVSGVSGVSGTWLVVVTGPATFTLTGSSSSGAYTSGGVVWSNSVGGVATNTYDVVVKQCVDYTTAPTPYSLSLEPTVSLFSSLNAGTVSASLAGAPRVLYQAATRDVFQLFFSSPAAKASNFGFPSIAWPPSHAALQQFDAPSFGTYNAACGCVPVSSSYTAPFCWNLLPPDYIIMLLVNPCGSRDVHTHTYKQSTKPIFAKLYLTSPFLTISEQMLFSTFAGFQRLNRVSVEFQNPDGSPVEFNGRPHSYELLFTLFENTADTQCF